MLFMRRLKDRLTSRLPLIANEDGQALVEYGLLVSLVAVACAGGVEALGTGVAGLYSHVQSVYP
jgi:Flp pilus assembly pilin Flp